MTKGGYVILKKKGKEGSLSAQQKKQLTDEEKEYKSKRKLVQEKLIKFATRIPAFAALKARMARNALQPASLMLLAREWFLTMLRTRSSS